MISVLFFAQESFQNNLIYLNRIKKDYFFFHGLVGLSDLSEIETGLASTAYLWTGFQAIIKFVYKAYQLASPI